MEDGRGEEDDLLSSAVETRTKSFGESDDDDGFGDLPKELRGLKDKVFQFKEELEAEVWSRGFGDVPVVLDPETGRARLRMTSGAHGKVTMEIAKFFEQDWSPLAVAINSDNVVYIQPTTPGRRVYTRKPDIAFWGPTKVVSVTRRGRSITRPLELNEPPMRNLQTRDQVANVNPDVVIQFSWGNGDSYEERAIDDMMNRVLTTYNPPQPNNSPPRLGFLIKIRTTKKRTANGRKVLKAIDVYKIPLGATKMDAVANRNGATHSRYVPGGADVVVQITAADLGIPAGTNPTPPRTYDISAADLFEDLS